MLTCVAPTINTIQVTGTMGLRASQSRLEKKTKKQLGSRKAMRWHRSSQAGNCTSASGVSRLSSEASEKGKSRLKEGKQSGGNRKP